MEKLRSYIPKGWKSSTWKSFLNNRKLFHKVGPKKSNFIYCKIFRWFLKSFFTLSSRIKWDLELSRALGPHEFNLSEGVHSDLSSSSFKLVSESSVEAENILIPELPLPYPWSTCFSYGAIIRTDLFIGNLVKFGLVGICPIDWC